MQIHRTRPLFSLLIVSGTVLLAAGCAAIQYYSFPKDRPSAELVVTMPPGSSVNSYVILSAFAQPETCLDPRLLQNSTAKPGEPAINRLEAGRLQTIRITLMRSGINGHQWQCASMLGFLPEAGARYEINPLSQGWQCVPNLVRQSSEGIRLPAEHKLRIAAPGTLFANKAGDCADNMVLK